MIAHCNRPDQFRARTNVDMPANSRNSTFGVTERDLLEQQAIGTNFRIRVNDDAVGVGYQQAPSNLAV